MSSSSTYDSYIDGKTNKAIRLYFYLQKGVGVFNEFKYVFATIFGIYYTLKLENPIWMISMFVISLPLLTLTGWVYVNKASKVLDWLGIEFTTHWGKYGFTLQERIIELLEGIKDK